MFWAEKRAEPWFAVCHAKVSMLAKRWDRLGRRKRRSQINWPQRTIGSAGEFSYSGASPHHIRYYRIHIVHGIHLAHQPVLGPRWTWTVFSSVNSSIENLPSSRPRPL